MSNNMLVFLTVLFISFAASVTATSGSDVYNNLFSDLSPLIALFGEQVTKQFLSQSIVFADCVLFAAAPLGILTGVVSAIRLGGYAWLRAVIGRAAESRAAAGLELTAATSSGICELWDGKSAVRIQGTAKILSILYTLTPKITDFEDETDDQEPLLVHAATSDSQDDVIVDFESAKTLGWITSYGPVRQRPKKLQSRSRARWDQSEEDTLPPEDVPAGIRNPIPPIPPNIALNASPRPSDFVVGSAALFGFLIQSAVLVLGGLVTYKFVPSDSDGVPTYALPLLVSGTSLVFLGMLICAQIVVASSRRETVCVFLFTFFQKP